MKYKIPSYIIALLLLTVSVACKKEQLSVDDFEVVLTNIPTKVGDTATFSISGNPDFITFYSGEKGKNVAYRSRLLADSALPLITFATSGQNISSANYPNSLSLLVSTNYTGDTLAIGSANWINITDSAKLATGSTRTESGIVNLSDYKNFDKIYLAFKYAVATATIAAQPTWTIHSFNYNNLSLPDSNLHSIKTIGIAGWQTKDILNYVNGWSIASNQLKITGGAVGANAKEDWVITKFHVRSVNPDVGIPIKNISEKVTNYAYKFTKAGTYEMGFLASFNRINGTKEIIKKIKVVIN